MNLLNDLSINNSIFFNYMKEKYEVHFKSNIFLRDLLYAIRGFYEKKGIKLSYPESEKLALDFADTLVKEGKLQIVGKNTWKVNFSLETSVTDLETVKEEVKDEQVLSSH